MTTKVKHGRDASGLKESSEKSNNSKIAQDEIKTINNDPTVSSPFTGRRSTKKDKVSPRTSHRGPSPRRKKKEDEEIPTSEYQRDVVEQQRKIGHRRRHQKNVTDAHIKEIELLKKENESLKRELKLRDENLEKEKKRQKAHPTEIPTIAKKHEIISAFGL